MHVTVRRKKSKGDTARRMNYGFGGQTFPFSQSNASVKERYAVKESFRKSNSTPPENCSDWSLFRCFARVPQSFRAVVFFFAVGSLIPTAYSSGTVTNCDQASLLNALNGGGKVTFACDGTITLTNTITIATSTVVDGSGHSVVISGNNAVRVFSVGTGAALTLVNVTIANGNSTAGSGIWVLGGTITLVNCTLSNNTAIAQGGDGHGGAVWSGIDSVIAASNCTFTANIATGSNGRGGAIYSNGRVTLATCTFFGNSAVADGHGGSGYGGAIQSYGNVTAIHCTFGANRALINNGFGLGGAFSVGGSSEPGVVILRNCILASNEGGNTDYAGNITDGGNNISSDSTCKFTAPGSFNNTDPRLAPLADNGGPTKTMALLEDSPAIDAGSADCPATDQRGVARPIGARCDIGAFEGSISLPRFSQGFSPATILERTTSRLTFILSNNAAVAYAGVVFTNDLPPQITVASNPAISNNCDSGTISAPPGGNRIVASGMTLAPQQTCVSGRVRRGVVRGERGPDN